MPFITQGKTNWKYILIVLILAIIVGGGILGWIKMQEVAPAEFPEIKKPEKIEEETADWKTYRNEEYGFEIKYPRFLLKSDWNYETEHCIYLTSEVVKGMEWKGASVCIEVVSTLPKIYATPEQELLIAGNEPPETSESKPLLSEEVTLNDIVFKKEYYGAYGGMGAWGDNLITCSTKHKDKYYLIYLDHHFIGGVPGAEGEGIPTVEDLVRECMKGDVYIEIFNQMLSTFRFLE